ncbi:hypothetical protein J14TS2_34070 [Bacillus sp. J14TS2]|uniref:hypothetical protein n=1 Tax=Bacillus sp. J14TS2 TaxID=2807188 RepID=UPI001B0C3F13|nr:hypothetical protein [Bacillus sp. J14TS2]GIN72932.1 hypothetical protein J14TS2_34070 [Bacillus sp. J14TS2]
MKPEDSDNCFVVNSTEELLSALEKKAPLILITKFYKKEFLEHAELPLTELEQMGLELGFHGGAELTSGPLFQLINFLSKDSKQQKKIASKLRKYTLKQKDDDLLLYLRQLDY